MGKNFPQFLENWTTLHFEHFFPHEFAKPRFSRIHDILEIEQLLNFPKYYPGNFDTISHFFDCSAVFSVAWKAVSMSIKA